MNDYDDDDILSTIQLAKRLEVDPKAIRRVASLIGGRRIGYRWKFRWGTVKEFFKNAYFETGQGQLLDGPCEGKWQADCEPLLWLWKERRPRVEGSEGMGGGTNKSANVWGQDPFGLRAAYLMGRELPAA